MTDSRDKTEGAVSPEQALEALKTLREREAHLQSILDTVPDAMVVIDELRHHAVVQRPPPSASSATRPKGGGRPQRQHADAARPTGRRARRLPRATWPPASAGSSASAASWSASGKDGSTFPMELAVGEMRPADRPLLHRLHPRPERAAGDGGAAAGAAVRAGPHVAPDGHGRDGLDAGPRAEPAALRIANYLKGSRRLLESAGRRPAAPKIRDAIDKAGGPGAARRRTSSAASATSSPAARANARSRTCPSSSRRPSALALVGAKELGVRVRFQIDAAPTWCWPTRSRSSRCCST
jgi:two-component system sensor kinase FixL